MFYINEGWSTPGMLRLEGWLKQSLLDLSLSFWFSRSGLRSKILSCNEYPGDVDLAAQKSYWSRQSLRFLGLKSYKFLHKLLFWVEWTYKIDPILFQVSGKRTALLNLRSGYLIFPTVLTMWDFLTLREAIFLYFCVHFWRVKNVCQNIWKNDFQKSHSL